MKFQLLFLCSLLALPLHADPPLEWEAIEAETDLEQRAEDAIEFARADVDPTLAAYEEGRPEEARRRLERMVEAALLAEASLEETGKEARKRPKHFKRAEIGLRRLIRSLENVKEKLIFEDRADLDPVINQLEEIRQRLLLSILERK